MTTKDQTGEEVAAAVSHMANGMLYTHEFIDALSREHPTLLGQISKAVAVAVCKQVARNADWRPFDQVGDKTNGSCMRGGNHGELQDRQALGFYRDVITLPVHAHHDGRIDCSTVIGAELAARQRLI